MNPRKQDVPVGGILTLKNGKQYQVISSPKPVQHFVDDCDICAFHAKTSLWCRGMKCASAARSDNDDVYFIRRKDLEIIAQVEKDI